MTDWMQTYTGKRFYPLDPRDEDIDILDIAHALSMLCRYGGHCRRFYSVAEHSVLLARYTQARGYGVPIALLALLHDAAEAYLVDVPRPIKGSLPEYREIEERLGRMVVDRFVPGYFTTDFIPFVKVIDTRILLDEKAQNMSDGPVWDSVAFLTPLGVTLQFWTPAEAEAAFLDMYAELANA